MQIFEIIYKDVHGSCKRKLQQSWGCRQPYIKRFGTIFQWVEDRQRWAVGGRGRQETAEVKQVYLSLVFLGTYFILKLFGAK